MNPSTTAPADAVRVHTESGVMTLTLNRLDKKTPSPRPCTPSLPTRWPAPVPTPACAWS